MLSLKVIESGTIRKLGADSPSVVTMVVSLTVYEIFSVKESRDHETVGRGCSRSFENDAVR